MRKLAPFPVVTTPPGLRVNTHVPTVGKPFNMTLPVVVQVGWFIVPTTGAVGVLGIVLIVAVPVPTHVEPTVLTAIVYVPDAKLLNIALLWYVPPFKLYSNGLVPVAFTTSVPVLTVQVGCVTLAAPTEGLLIIGLIIAVVVATQIEPTVLTRIVYVPEANLLKIALLWYVPPFKLYSKGLVLVAFTAIVPVLTVQVGCITVDVPTVGAPATGLTVTVRMPSHVEPTVLTRIVYVPEATPLNIGLLWYIPPFKLYSKRPVLPVALT
jgi:hypothetical protein